MPSLKVNFLFVWCLRDTVFAGFSSFRTALCPIAPLSVYTTHSLARLLIHSFIHLFIQTFIGCPLLKAYREGEVAKVGKAPRLIFLKCVCVCVCGMCAHVHTCVNTTDCSVGR